MDLEVKTRVIKRNGEEVDFRLEKIVNAIKKANEEVENIHRMNDFQIIAIAEKIAQQAEEFTHAVNVEDIQDMVETGIMEMRGYEVAQKYVRYRYKRELTRKSNTTDNGILALIDHMNEEVKQENSNKNPVINSTQRDYMAGEVSKDLTKRVLLPEEIVRAHEEGIIHFHDMDYFAQKEHNCDLINLEDMLQNGTVISETMIEKPHSFFTACNVTTQIVAQVASNQYGGQSFTLSHLAPFVDVSRQKLRKSVIEERIESGEVLDDAIIDKITERRLRTEVQSGIQTIQYQLITLMTCNGQAPFVTVFMYLDEVPEGRTRDVVFRRKSKVIGAVQLCQKTGFIIPETVRIGVGERTDVSRARLGINRSCKNGFCRNLESLGLGGNTIRIGQHTHTQCSGIIIASVESQECQKQYP